MSVNESATGARLLTVGLVCLALALVSAGCGTVEAGARDGDGQGRREGSVRVNEVMSQLRVVPIALEAIQKASPKKKVTDVRCTSDVMYVSEGSVAQCSARLDGVASGWTLTFRDPTGDHRLTRRPGPPWKFATS